MKPLEMGVSFLPDATPDVKPADTYYADALRLAELADDAGLGFVKITEHYLNPYGGYCPSPLAFLAAVAARTRRIRLLTGGILPVFHHPIQLAAEAAMIDAISGGRLDVGFGRGYMPYEFAALGVPLDESRQRFNAVVETVIRLWTEQGVTAQTPYFAFTDASIMPRPVQQPHPPVWVAAVASPESFTWIGQKGFNLMMTSLGGSTAQARAFLALYRDAFAQHHGGNGAAGQVMLSLPLYVAADDQKAIAEGDFYLGRYLRVWSDAANAWNDVRSSAYNGYTGFGRMLASLTPEAVRLRGGALVGSPARIVELVQQLREQIDPDSIIWQVDFGGMPGDLAHANLRRLIEEVAPHL